MTKTPPKHSLYKYMADVVVEVWRANTGKNASIPAEDPMLQSAKLGGGGPAWFTEQWGTVYLTHILKDSTFCQIYHHYPLLCWFKKKNCGLWRNPSISIKRLILYKVAVSRSLTRQTQGARRDYTLDGTPVHHRAHTHTYTHTEGNLE